VEPLTCSAQEWQQGNRVRRTHSHSLNAHSVPGWWWTLELATKATKTGKTHATTELRFKVSDSGCPKERIKWNKEWRIVPG